MDGDRQRILVKKVGAAQVVEQGAQVAGRPAFGRAGCHLAQLGVEEGVRNEEARADGTHVQQVPA